MKTDTDSTKFRRSESLSRTYEAIDRMVQAGFTTPLIAEILGISEKFVKTRRDSRRKKRRPKKMIENSWLAADRKRNNRLADERAKAEHKFRRLMKGRSFG